MCEGERRNYIIDNDRQYVSHKQIKEWKIFGISYKVSLKPIKLIIEKTDGARS